MKKTLLIITIIFFVFLVNLRVYIYDVNFYEHEFKKLNVYKEIPKEIALENTNKLISLFKENKELDTDFFNEKERTHLNDVKSLINQAMYLLYISIFLLIILLILNLKNLSRIFLVSGLLIIFFILISLFINFDYFFILFHKISFRNDLWLLNPETDNLIKLFSIGFFKDFLIRIGINSFVFALFLVMDGLLLRRFEKA